MTRTPRILFVDDEPSVLKSFEALLRKHRHRTAMEFVEGGAVALARLDQASYDVVVTASRMSRVDGPMLLRYLRDHHPETVRVLRCTGEEQGGALELSSYAHQVLPQSSESGQVESVLERAFVLRELIADPDLRCAVGRLRALPSLPRTYERLTSIMSSESSGIGDVANVISSDISVCATALKLANSAFFGVGRPVTSVGQAVHVLGVEIVKTIVLERGLFDRTGLPAVLHGFAEALHEHSQLVGGVAADLIGRAGRQEAFTAGMLHDVGRMLLELGFRDGADVPPRHPASSHAIRSDEVDHAKLGAYLLALWGLPLSVIDAVRRHHEDDDSTSLAGVIYEAEELVRQVSGDERPTSAAVAEMHRVARDSERSCA